MIKNLKKFSKEEEKRRSSYLRRLSLKDSRRIVEAILSSSLMLKMKFADDDRPVALFKLVEKAKKRKLCKVYLEMGQDYRR